MSRKETEAARGILETMASADDVIAILAHGADSWADGLSNHADMGGLDIQEVCQEMKRLAEARVYWAAVGSVRGWCGHRHRTPEAALRCADGDQAGIRSRYPSTYPTQSYSDRMVREYVRRGADEPSGRTATGRTATWAEDPRQHPGRRPEALIDGAYEVA